MDISVIIIVVGVIAAIYDIVKKQAKEADRRSRRQEERKTETKVTRNRTFVDKLETYIEETEKGTSRKRDSKDYKNYKRINEKRASSEGKQRVHKKEERHKVSIPKVEIKSNKEYDLDYEAFKVKPKVKKNPFEVTENPVVNAVIASEILGKPRCKK